VGRSRLRRQEWVKNLLSCLESAGAYAKQPDYLHFACAVHVFDHVHVMATLSLNKIRDIELYSGFGRGMGNGPPQLQYNVERLIDCSREVSHWTTALSLVNTHADITISLLSFLKERHQDPGDMRSALNLMESHLVNAKASMRYLEGRAKSLSATVSSQHQPTSSSGGSRAVQQSLYKPILSRLSNETPCRRSKLYQVH
jgi:hypothetical protein